MLHHWFLAVLTDGCEFWITHMELQTRERNHKEGSEKCILCIIITIFPRRD